MNTIATAATVAAVTQAPTTAPADPQRAFDFLFGYWRVSHRKLRSRLTNCTDWDEFDTIQEAWSLMDGICNADESFRIGPAASEGPLGATFRCLDQKAKLWSIYWVSPRDGVLGLPPVVGGFDGNIGHFDCDEMIGGQLVRVRYTWTVLSATTARWEQGFSLDKGQTWEVNWIMDFARLDASEYAALLAEARAA